MFDKRRRKLKFLILKIGVSLAAIAVLAVGVAYAVDHVLSSRHESVFIFYPELSSTSVNVMIDDAIVLTPTPPLVVGDNIFLPVDFINERLDPYTFWDRGENIIITTETQVRRYRINQLDYTHNEDSRRLYEPFIVVDNMAFIPMAFAENEYNVRISYHEEYMIVTVDDAGVAGVRAQITDDGRLRARPDNHAPYMEEVHIGDSVVLLEEAEEGFRRVRSANAIVGYVHESLIGETSVTAAVVRPPEQSLDRKQPLRYPIVMVWDAMFMNNRDFWNVAPEVTVMSPAWFTFQTDPVIDGTIIDAGNRDYVDFAHANGRMVWPKLTDNFSAVVSREVLSDTDVRKFVIDQILDLIVYYNLDGINVDYEAVLPDFAPYFIQFLRELRPPMHELGAHLSVALFVPRYTMYMNRTEIARTVDYVAVMAYDEHWSGSPEPGPVASLPFVEEGIVATMNEVPREMVIMGIPVYNRVWIETTYPDGSSSHEIRNIGMDFARRMFTENGATFYWIDEIGSYYAEFPDPVYPNVMHRVWLECERSVARKLDMARAYELPGIAIWQSGLENAATWDVIREYIEAMRN